MSARDSQMPFDTPMGLGGWLTEITGLGLLRFHIGVFFPARDAALHRDDAGTSRLWASFLQ